MTAENTADPERPDTHRPDSRLWVTPRSWEKWVERYEAAVMLAPAYPGLEVEVEGRSTKILLIEA